MVTTKKQVAAAEVGWHPDAGCQGFALLVKPNGARRWVLDYRFNGRQRRIQVGRADVLPRDEALKIARKHRVAIDHGMNATWPRGNRSAATVMPWTRNWLAGA